MVDETGDMKKGTASAGRAAAVARDGRRIEKLAGRGLPDLRRAAHGHALIDRELYSLASWTDDPARCQAAGIPEDTEFATKLALAQRMIAHALDAGVAAAWVAGDEVYGADPGLREDLEDRRIGTSWRSPQAGGPDGADARQSPGTVTTSGKTARL